MGYNSKQISINITDATCPLTLTMKLQSGYSFHNLYPIQHMLLTKAIKLHVSFKTFKPNVLSQQMGKCCHLEIIPVHM